MAVAARTDTGRAAQRLRTLQQLLLAGDDLLQRHGRVPSIPEVADAAGVSRATAYRYFPNPDALLVALPTDRHVPAVDEVLGTVSDDDLEARVDAVVLALSGAIYEREAATRAVLRASLDPDEAAARPPGDDGRFGLIDAALRPSASRLGLQRARRLRAALGAVLGIEAVVALRDAGELDAADALEHQRWMARSLVRATVADVEALR